MEVVWTKVPQTVERHSIADEAALTAAQTKWVEMVGLACRYPNLLTRLPVRMHSLVHLRLVVTRRSSFDPAPDPGARSLTSRSRCWAERTIEARTVSLSMSTGMVSSWHQP